MKTRHSNTLEKLSEKKLTNFQEAQRPALQAVGVGNYSHTSSSQDHLGNPPAPDSPFHQEKLGLKHPELIPSKVA
jgi:hypothetical protein